MEKQGFAVVKVPQGKLVKVRLNFSDQITSISITGDFFLHPEDKIVEIETALLHTPINISQKDLTKKLQNVISKNSIQLFGVSSDTISEAVLNAISSTEKEEK